MKIREEIHKTRMPVGCTKISSADERVIDRGFNFQIYEGAKKNWTARQKIELRGKKIELRGKKLNCAAKKLNCAAKKLNCAAKLVRIFF
jgi:hypothetical protein